MDNDKDVVIQQADEVEALTSIYARDFVTVSPGSYRIDIRSNQDDRQDNMTILLDWKFTTDYPLKSPPEFSLSAPWMDRKDKTQLVTELHSIFADNIGEPVMYLWIEKCRQFLQEVRERSPIGEEDHEVKDEVENPYEELSVKIIHGEPLVDRKSVFQAHACQVSSLDEVKEVVRIIKENKKTSTATHNVVAYRLSLDSKTMLQDCDDDGETHAGGRLLHLLQVIDVKNVVVVVSRWFGGILLGADRFKHINNVSRDVLSQMGLIVSSEQDTSKNKTSKK